MPSSRFPVPAAVDPFAASLGYKNWNYSPAWSVSGSAPGSQNIFAVGLWLPAGTLCTGATIDISTAASGTAPTGFFLGFADSGNIRTQTGNLAADAGLTSLGTKQYAFSATYTTTASGVHYVMILKNGTFSVTDVQLAHAGVPVTSSALSGQLFPFGVTAAGQTVLPSNGTAITVSTGARPFRVGIYQMSLTLTPLSQGSLTVTPAVPQSHLTFLSGQVVNDYQGGGWSIPAATSVFSVDTKGNVLAGPNELLGDIDGSDSQAVMDFGYSSNKRRPYARQLVLTEVGNPTNVYLRCYGGTWPLGPRAQLPVDAGIGSIRWMPATDQLDFQGQTAQILSRTMELPTHTACGGDLRLMTTPIGQSQPLTAVVIDHDGTLMLGSNKDTYMRASASNTIKLANAAGTETAGLWAPDGIITKTKAGIPSDGDFRAGMQQSGLIALDTTNSRAYFRVGSTWKYAALT